jgi:hypothetical protein
VNGLYKTELAERRSLDELELAERRGRGAACDELELATAEWVDWSGYAGDLWLSPAE